MENSLTKVLTFIRLGVYLSNNVKEMENNEVIRLLDGLSVSDKQVEMDLGMPTSTLGHIRNGSRGLPKKFEDAFMRYCSDGGLPVVDGFEVLDYDTFSFGGSGLRLRVTTDLVMELYGKYCGGVKKIEPSAVVEDVAQKVVEVPKVAESKSEVLAGLRGIISDVMEKPVSKDTFVFPDGLDEIKVDYKKLYDGCEFAEEYRGLWDRIKADDNLSTKEKNDWKLVLGAR